MWFIYYGISGEHFFSKQQWKHKTTFFDLLADALFACCECRDSVEINSQILVSTDNESQRWLGKIDWMMILMFNQMSLLLVQEFDNFDHCLHNCVIDKMVVWQTELLKQLIIHVRRQMTTSNYTKYQKLLSLFVAYPWIPVSDFNSVISTYQGFKLLMCTKVD